MVAVVVVVPAAAHSIESNRLSPLKRSYSYIIIMALSVVAELDRCPFIDLQAAFAAAYTNEAIARSLAHLLAAVAPVPSLGCCLPVAAPCGRIGPTRKGVAAVRTHIGCRCCRGGGGGR